MSLPYDAAARAEHPMADGLLYYFPAALAEVARCSKVGNDQHNPGQPLHWAMAKSTDHANKILRHLLETGTDDADGIPHSVKVAWRALALAQEDLMKRKGAPVPRNAIPANHAKTLYEEALQRTIDQDRAEFGFLDPEGGFHFTDGGQSSQTMIFPETPELSPAMEALAELQDEEPPFRNPDAPNGEGEGE